MLISNDSPQRRGVLQRTLAHENNGGGKVRGIAPSTKVGLTAENIPQERCIF